MTNKISLILVSVTVSVCCSFILFSNAAVMDEGQRSVFQHLFQRQLQSGRSLDTQSSCECTFMLNDETHTGNCSSTSDTCLPNAQCTYPVKGINYTVTNECAEDGSGSCKATWSYSVFMAGRPNGKCQGKTCVINIEYKGVSFGNMSSTPCR